MLPSYSLYAAFTALLLNATTASQKSILKNKVASPPVLHFAPYTKQQFLRLPHVTVDTTEKHHLLAAKGRVVRRKHQLIITLSNQKTVRLANNYTDIDTDKFAVYRLQGAIVELKSWVIDVRLWESGHTLLINQETGKRTILWSKPVLSPDKKHFVTVLADYVFEDDNGIQYWGVSNGTPVKIWEKTVSDWGPEEARWISNNSIAIKQSRPQDDASQLLAFKYVSVSLQP